MMNQMLMQVLLAVHTVLIVVLGGLLLLTVRQVGMLSLRLGPVGSRMTVEGPEIGSDQSANDVVREIVRQGGEGRSILIALVSPQCGGCRILYPALKTITIEQQRSFTVVAVASSLTQEETQLLRKELSAKAIVVESEKLFKDWSVSGTPYCVILDEKLKVRGKGITNTIEHLDSLVNTIVFKAATVEDYLKEHNSLRISDAGHSEEQSVPAYRLSARRLP